MYEKSVFTSSLVPDGQTVRHKVVFYQYIIFIQRGLIQFVMTFPIDFLRSVLPENIFPKVFACVTLSRGSFQITAGSMNDPCEILRMQRRGIRIGTLLGLIGIGLGLQVWVFAPDVTPVSVAG